MNFYQFINIIWSRKGVALSALIVTVLTTLVVSLLLPKQYLATTSIVAEQRSIDPVTGMNLPVQLLPGYIATQAEMISSQHVARKVVDKLKLHQIPELQEDFATAKVNGDIRDWIAEMLLKKLDIRPSRESSVMQVDFTFDDPQTAADIANAFADAYIQTTIELRAQPAKLNADWFDTQLTTLRERLEQAQLVLSNYQQQHGIVATSDRIDLENSRLADLSRQLVENQARTHALQSRKNLLSSTVKRGGSSGSLPEVLNNPLIQSLKTELARVEASFAELSRRVDVNHPQYRQAQAEMNNLQQKIHAETNLVLSSIGNDAASANQLDTLLANALAEQKAKVLGLKQQNDEIAVLNREVENAQRVYDATMQRAVQTRMESEMNQTNISILNPAIPPQKHAKPKLLLNLIISIFLGTLLGVGAALLAELMDRRVRSAFDISELLTIPVFAVVAASTTKPKRITRLFYLGQKN